jgi:hypothetical protein
MAYTTIKKPSDYFNTKLYTGNGTTATGITGVGFQPDWTWIKARSIGYDNNLFDVVRGSTKRLISNTSGAETTQSEMIKSFDSDGFTLGNDAGVNANTETFVSWNWLADNTSGSANTDGSISSTVSASATSGFSIVKYTAGSSGANTDTIGHGLNSVPSMIILKTTTAIDSWVVYHQSNGAGKSMVLNNNSVVATNANIYPTTPTSSVFYPGNTATTNGSSRSYIAYCFAEKQGYSKFGNYFGNGSADGPFVYTGFKPAFIMIKDADNLEQWFIFDNKRNTSNVSKNLLYASDAAAETTSGANQIDILSNGFKMRSTNNGTNRSGGEGFTYMAFAEEPLVGDNPATAR